jgi:hypothetical protein
VLLCLAAAPAVLGQRLRLYSEFQRVRPDGEIVQADRGASPREILSPAVVRNSHVTYRIVVAAPPAVNYSLYIAQNPEDSVKADLYQEGYVKVGDEWVPDTLVAVKHPVTAQLGNDQKVQTYLLDLAVPESAPVGRFRLEVQLGLDDGWTVYPLEVRVQTGAILHRYEPRGALPPVAARADLSVDAALRSYICPKPKQAPPKIAELNVRALIARNAFQDMAMAPDRELAKGRPVVVGALLGAGGLPSVASYCTDPPKPAPAGAEWWLEVRRYLYQGILRAR